MPFLHGQRIWRRKGWRAVRGNGSFSPATCLMNCAVVNCLPSPRPSLPAPDRARELVVRAVAKLNVEMRKTGGAGLDTKTILRLQQLIRQELEKGGEK